MDHGRNRSGFEDRQFPICPAQPLISWVPLARIFCPSMSSSKRVKQDAGWEVPTRGPGLGLGHSMVPILCCSPSERSFGWTEGQLHSQEAELWLGLGWDRGWWS